MTDAAHQEFISPIVFPDTYWPEHIGVTNINNGTSAILYGGCQGKTKAEVSQDIATTAQTLIPTDVNIRFAAGSVSGRCKQIRVSTVGDLGIDVLNTYGFTDKVHCAWRNYNPFGICNVYVDKL